METIIIYDYKEPLRKVEKGFGYLGCISGTPDGKKIECHICGGLKENLNHHVLLKHKMKLNEYKDTYSIAHGTKLISPAFKEQRRLDFLERFPKEVRDAGRMKGYKKMLADIKAGRKVKNKKYSLETLNKRGTCPDQIIAKLKEVTKLIDKVPTGIEFTEHAGQKYYLAALREFGTFNGALKKAQLEVQKAGMSKGTKFKRWHEDELLECIKIFFDEYRRIPTYSDFGHGILPRHQIYMRRFGGIENARQMVLPNELQAK